MKAFMRTDFPNGRSHIFVRSRTSHPTELVHFFLVLSNSGTLWVDVFWPYDEEAEQLTRSISEQEFWQTFRQWRLGGLTLGDNERVARMLASKRLDKRVLSVSKQK